MIMSFSESLNQLMKLADCNAKELAKVSGVSQATLSRYRNFTKNSSVPVKLVTALSKGINILSDGRLRYEDIFAELSQYCKIEEYDIGTVVDNLNTLIDTLDINASELAKSLNFDASYLSRIRNGKRFPSDMRSFVSGIVSFVARKVAGNDSQATVCELINSDGSNLRADLEAWLLHGTVKGTATIYEFLTTLDNFNLDEYISAVHFDDIKTPTLPFSIPTSKNYYGIEEMRRGELAFYRNAVLSKSKDDIFMHSQMPIAEMAQDKEFYKKMMIAVAMVLKKGIHINIIHDVYRPWNEMMLGLEAWIPLYMTGQISPYYLEKTPKGVYTNGLMVAGTAVLVGEGVSGFPEDSKYYVTTNREEIAYYRKKSENLLKKALPLMNIYREDEHAEWQKVLSQIADVKGDRRVINQTLPIATISEELFFSIIKKNAVKHDIAEKLWSEIKLGRQRLEAILEHDNVIDEIPIMDRESFDSERVALSLSNMYFPTPVYYSYEDYLRHLDETEKFSRTHSNYSVLKSKNRFFRNIKISILGDEMVIVSKDNAPTIHFVIRHPKMVRAISGFNAIVSD